MTGKTFRDYVAEQAADMVRELEAHAEEKGGPGAWLDGYRGRWMSEARYQLDRLDEQFVIGTPEEVRKRAAHVCNFVMMAAQTWLHAWGALPRAETDGT